MVLVNYSYCRIRFADTGNFVSSAELGLRLFNPLDDGISDDGVLQGGISAVLGWAEHIQSGYRKKGLAVRPLEIVSYDSDNKELYRHSYSNRC